MFPKSTLEPTNFDLMLSLAKRLKKKKKAITGVGIIDSTLHPCAKSNVKDISQMVQDKPIALETCLTKAWSRVAKINFLLRVHSNRR